MSRLTSPMLRCASARPGLGLLLLLASAAWAVIGGQVAHAQEQEQAQDDSFRVALEMIVFLQLDPEASTEDLGMEPPQLPSPQIFPAPLALPDSGPATPPAPAGILALTRAQYEMEGIWTVMRRSAEYRPLAHFAWAMPADWNGEPTSLRLSTLSAAALPFSGLASLNEDRFVHMALDLRLPGDPDSGEVFRINERRRLLLGEIHYFDHPRFGAIARLFRYREAQEPEAQD